MGHGKESTRHYGFKNATAKAGRLNQVQEASTVKASKRRQFPVNGDMTPARKSKGASGTSSLIL